MLYDIVWIISVVGSKLRIRIKNYENKLARVYLALRVETVGDLK